MTEENKNIERSIEETVEEMKQKIDEIAKGAEEVHDEELSKKAAEVKDKAVEVLGKVSEKLQSAYKNAADSEEVKKAIEFVKVRSKEFADSSLKKIDELKNDEKVKNALENANSMVKDAGEKVSEVIEKALDSENGKKIIEKANEVKANVDEFLAKPEVAEKVEKVKEAGTELYEKAVASLKEWLRPNDKDEEK